MENEKMPRTENKMGVMPVGKLLISMSLPDDDLDAGAGAL